MNNESNCYLQPSFKYDQCMATISILIFPKADSDSVTSYFIVLLHSPHFIDTIFLFFGNFLILYRQWFCVCTFKT